MICHPPRSSLPKLSSSEEEYLEAIYRRQPKVGERAKVKELARDLGVKDPSVVEMLAKLKDKGLVTYDRSGAVLTGRGRDQAVRVVRRHKLAERLLSDVFGHDLPGVHEHACEFEHILDDELTDKIDKMLEKPATCPHGGPIPPLKGRSIDVSGERLTDIGCGENCVVMVIPEERELVERLLALNILPRAKVRIVEKLPRGAVILQCGKTQVALSREIASKIIVAAHRRRARVGRRREES